MSGHTNGPWVAEKTKGWGGDLCIVAQGISKPIFKAIKPDAYYTDFMPSSDGKRVILSTELASKNGRYVATDEIRKAIEHIEEANARLIAAAPDLLEALLELAESVDTWNRYVEAMIGRQPNTGMATQKARAAIAKAVQTGGQQ